MSYRVDINYDLKLVFWRKLNNMKPIYLCFIFLIALNACSPFKSEIDIYKLQLRNSLYYEVNSDKPYTGNVYENFSNTDEALKGIVDKNYKPQRSSYFHVTDGKLDGKLTWWYENGQTRKQGENKDGHPIGEWHFYLKNGQIKTLANYDNDGLLHGRMTSYFDNGQIHSIDEFQHGKKWNIIEDHHIDGSTVTQDNLKDGNGYVYCEDANGNFVYYEVYKDGKATTKAYTLQQATQFAVQ